MISTGINGDDQFLGNKELGNESGIRILRRKCHITKFQRWLQASYMQVALTSKENNLSNSCNGRAISKPEPMLPRDWKDLLEESKSFANVEISQLLEQMEKVGWALKNVLLSPSEKITYRTLGENENPQP